MENLAVSGTYEPVAVEHRKRRPRRSDLRLTDGRTSEGRRKSALVKAITEAIMGGNGALDVVTAAQVARIAELSVTAEFTRAKMLAGATGADLERLVKLESELRRAWVQLGTPLRDLRPPQPSPGLAIAEARWAAQEARGARKAQQEPAE